mgnify:FL=1
MLYRIILETEASVIAGKVAMRGADADVPLSEQVYFPLLLCVTMDTDMYGNCFLKRKGKLGIYAYKKKNFWIVHLHAILHHEIYAFDFVFHYTITEIFILTG